MTLMKKHTLLDATDSLQGQSHHKESPWKLSAIFFFCSPRLAHMHTLFLTIDSHRFRQREDLPFLGTNTNSSRTVFQDILLDSVVQLKAEEVIFSRSSLIGCRIALIFPLHTISCRLSENLFIFI
ncbi:hypothetical protein P5V15_009121 [Pogonomyrmex californicus]